LANPIVAAVKTTSAATKTTTGRFIVRPPCRHRHAQASAQVRRMCRRPVVR
jgi:hypothetical protein